MKNPFARRQEQPRRQVERPKKGKCKIKFKRTDKGEEMEFSPECTAQQIEMARQMREQRG